jgi:hypothetical protein
MCIDYRPLDKYTRKMEFPFSNADMLLDMLSCALVYSALDLALGYHQLRINPEDTPKTAINAQFGQFEWLVMPFGLISAPSSYQRLIYYVLQPHKNTFFLVHLDDSLILATHPMITYNTLTLLFPYLHPMTCAYDFKNVVFSLATNLNTWVT